MNVFYCKMINEESLFCRNNFRTRILYLSLSPIIIVLLILDLMELFCTHNTLAKDDILQQFFDFAYINTID